MDDLVKSSTTILLAVVGIALLAVLVSRNSNTANVLSAGGNAFSNILKAATGPVSGYGLGTSIGNGMMGPASY